MSEICSWSVSRIAEAIRDGDVSSAEVVSAHLKRIEQVNPALNAVVALAADRAMEEAAKADEAVAREERTGALHGVPVTLKDSIDTEGIVTTYGTMGRAGHVPDRDATVAARLRQAGAIVLGKTNTPEFTMAFETDNLVYGKTNNPHDTSRTPGGSSGGAAAIVTAAGSPLDLGSDTGGSIRQPSHFSGIAGIKPTSGRVPRTGHAVPYGMGASDSLTQIGPMARYVSDLTLVLPIIAGPDWEDPAIMPVPLRDPADVDVTSLRVAFHPDNGVMAPTADIIEAACAAADALRDAGVTVVEDKPEALESDSGLGVMDADGLAWLKRMLESAGTEEPHPWLRAWIASASEKVVPAAEYTARLEKLDEFRSEMLAFMEGYDAILCPPSAVETIPHGTWTEGQTKGAFSYTSVYNTTGWPGSVVRVGTSSSGLPIGAQVVGRPWREDVCLALASVLESALGGWRLPDRFPLEAQ